MSEREGTVQNMLVIITYPSVGCLTFIGPICLRD